MSSGRTATSCVGQGARRDRTLGSRGGIVEERLGPAYRALKIEPGQLEVITGIRERRYWEPGFTVTEGAQAAARALERSSVASASILAVLTALTFFALSPQLRNMDE
jgi:3-oxoacyl-[acyl-carrier-protein] synthase III